MTDTPAPRSPQSASIGWQQRVGSVLVFEHLARQGVLYLRTRTVRTNRRGVVVTNTQVKSLKRTLRDEKGKPLVGRARKAAEDWALAEAAKWLGELGGEAATAAAAVPDPALAERAAQDALTITAGLAAVAHPKTGHYRAATGHHRKVLADARNAERIWGGATRWAALRPSHWVDLWRTRMAEVRALPPRKSGRPFDGLAAAIYTVRRVNQVADALRDAELLAAGAARPPQNWLEKLQKDYANDFGDGEVPGRRQPRHTIEETRRLITLAPLVDPRLGLAMAIGAELRPGQVLRTRRSDVTLPELPVPLPAFGADAEVDYGTVIVRGRGNKKAPPVDLTRAQRRALDVALDPDTGYLRELEAQYQLARAGGLMTPGGVGDYALFPAGHLLTRHPSRRSARAEIAPLVPAGGVLTGRRAARSAAWAEERRLSPISFSAINRLFRKVEALAEITPVEGRGWYGMRRATVDEADALNVSVGALKGLGGWTNEATPRDIYKARESRRDQREARDARAKIRQETDAAPLRPPTPAPFEDGRKRKRKPAVNTDAPPPEASPADTDNPTLDNDL